VLDAPKAAGGKCGDLRRGKRGRDVASILWYVWFTRYEGNREERMRDEIEDRGDIEGLLSAQPVNGTGTDAGRRSGQVI